MWLPHTVTVETASDGGFGTGGGGFEYAAGVQVVASVQPVSVETVIDQFGPDVDGDYSLFCSVVSADLFEHRSRVTLGSQIFEVVSKRVWSQGLPTDHIHVLMKEQRFA